jgi:dTDP-glucose 4,6-dehydratase
MDVIFKFEAPDIVIHGAAETNNDSPMLASSNVAGTQVIIDCCLKYKIEKLIYISTDKVYGSLENENSMPWNEESPLNPGDLYSCTKGVAEGLVKSSGLIYNIVRSSNNYGPRQSSERLVPKTIKCILEGKDIPLYGQSLQIRDWIHVFDNCNAIFNIMNNGAPNEIYNVSANQELSNIEVVQKICNYMEKGHSLINFIKDAEKHDFRRAIDSSKIRALGWKPNFKFKGGLPETINWYLSNQWFLK